MKPETIAALVAAGAAVLGVGGALFVGRWQLRGALRTAESNYQAALDAARASGNEAHQQWLRSTRREAYAAFLLAASRLFEAAQLLSDDAGANKIPADQRDARIAEVDVQVSQLENASVIVSLEGPDDLARNADLTTAALSEVGRVVQFQCKMALAWHDMQAMASEDDCAPPIRDYYRLAVDLNNVRPHNAGSILLMAASDLPDNVASARAALWLQRQSLPPELRELAGLVEDYAAGSWDDLNNRRNDRIFVFHQLRSEFINGARAVLGSSDTTTVS